MNTSKSIYWHQGLFLKPHHFQYLHAQQQEENLKLRKSIHPYFWGVSKLNIDEKELLSKNILIRELELVFMDGTSIDISQNAVVKSRYFNEFYDDTDSDLKIYIGLKNFNKDTLNVTEIDSLNDTKDINTRFITNSEATNAKNLYHKDEDAQIQFMDYYLKIFFEDEIKSINDYQIIQIAQIEKQSENPLLDNKFTPPLLNIEANLNLFETLRAIQKDLTSHVIQLQEYKLSSDALLKEPNYLKYATALQTLSMYAPQLNHMLKTKDIHPWKYYEVFLKLVGVLSTFSNRVNIFGKLENGTYLIRDYDHLNLSKCFDDIKMLINELLDVIIIGPEYILPFTKEETTFTLDCPVSIFHAKYRYFLVVKTPSNKDALQKSFLEFAKIASSSEIDTIVRRSLLGLPFELYEMPIQGLPQREDSYYYELLTNNKRWEHIQQTQNITIEFDEATDDVSIELIVLKN